MKPGCQPLFLAFCIASSTAPLSAGPCLQPRTVDEPVPGLIHLSLCRGEVATSTGYRVLVATLSHQSAADRLLERLQAKGIAALPMTTGSEYRIVTPPLPRRERAEELAERLLTEGFDPPLAIEEVDQDLTNPGGPWRIHVLEADPRAIEIRVAHALDAAIGLEGTANLARRHGAVAGVNGGYFQMDGLLAGDSQGVLSIDGIILSEPDRGRAAAGFFTRHGRTEAVFGRLLFRGEVRFGEDGRLAIDGVNRARGDDEIILFSPEFHRTTLTNRDGTEIVVDKGTVASVRARTGSTEIPASGFVLSIGRGRLDSELLAVESGDALSIETELLTLLPDPDREWEKVEFVVGGGPLLLWRGRRIEEPEKESISKVFFHARHPRTAVGERADGTLLMVTVDGRQPTVSVGMSLPELTDLMLELGASSAVNLDGGGSTTMAIVGQTVNIPSTGGPDRANGDGLLLFERQANRP